MSEQEQNNIDFDEAETVEEETLDTEPDAVDEDESEEEDSQEEEQGSDDTEEDEPQEDKKPKKDSYSAGVTKAINRITAKRKEAEDASRKKDEELQGLRDRLRISELANEQNRKPALERPKADDYDSGVHDPAYTQAYEAYQDQVLESKMDKKLSSVTNNLQKQNAQTRQIEIQKQKTKQHYRDAEKIKVSDYVETQEAAEAVLGSELLEALINQAPDSANLVYHLGKNLEKADDLAAMYAENPTGAAIQVGKLLGEMDGRKSKPKRKSTPNPDETPEGSLSGTGSKRKAKYAGLAGVKYE